MKLNFCIAVLMASICSINVASAENTDEELLSHGMWRDPSTGLIWMRCSLGQTWAGKSCKGFGKKYTWFEAMRVAENSSYENKKWQLPTKEELESISLKNDDGYVNNNIIFRPETDVSGIFWTSSVGKNDTSTSVNFVYGSSDDGSRGYTWYVRLVSASAADVFSNNLKLAAEGNAQEEEYLTAKKKRDEEDSIIHQEQIKEEEILKIRQREEAAQRAEWQVRLKKEAALSAQSMYLQAGKYDRNGQQSDAIRLYELLIEKFPSNPLAVQATNRLVGIKSAEDADDRAADRLRRETNRAIDAANRQQSQSSAECHRRKEAYKLSCGDSGWQCYERAKSICSE